MSNKCLNGCANKAFTDNETAVISVDSDGHTHPITSRTEIYVNCSVIPVIPSVTESVDLSQGIHGMKTTSYTREGDNIVSDEQPEVDIGERQISLERETLNTELQITESVLTALPEKEEKDTESVLHSVPERKEEDIYSVIQTVPERKEEDTCSVLHSVPDRKEEDTCSVLHSVPERKEEDTYSVLQAVPERKEEDTCSVLQTVPERKEEDTYSVLQTVPERKEEDTCSVIQVVPERKEEDTCSVIQVVPERKEEDTCSVLHSVPERKEEDTCSVLHSVPERKEEDTCSVLQTVPERKEEDTCSVLQTVPERKEEDTCSVLHSVPERKEEDTCSVLHSVPERKEEDTYSVLQTVPERKEEDKVIQIPADECNLYFSTGMKRERELKEKTDKFADDGLEETIKNVDGAQDGGWGWLIVLSSMLIHFIIGGFDRSGGILYLKFEEKFKTPAAVTAWVPSISSGLRLTLGPVVGVMCHRFSFRSVVIWGGFILVFALIISGFAPNIYFLFVSYGVIGGIGQAMAYSPAVVIVSAYFHKKLGTAIGLGTSGVGLGTFAIPLLLETSFTYYGYLGALIMAAAASLQIIVCGALMRPVSLHRRITEFNNRKRHDRKSVNSVSDNQNRIMSVTEPSTKAELTTDSSRQHASDSSRQHATDSSRQHATDSSRQHATDSSRQHATDSSRHHAYARKPQLPNDVDIVISVSKNKRKMTSRNSVVSLIRRASSVFLFQHDSSKTKTKTKLFDLSLLKDLRYCAFCVAILLFTLAFSSGMVFLPAFALQIGTSEFEAAYTVVVTGVSDGIGRLFAGFLFDRKFMKPYRIYIYNVLIIFMGVVSLTIPSLTTFSQLAVACAIYGSTIGMYVSQKSVIIVDLLGIENLSKSFGIVLFFQGIGVFIGPPLSGLLKDLNGKYDYAFYFGGSAVLLGSCILLVSNIIHFLKSRRVYQM